MMRLKDWQPWLVKVFLGLWGLQVIWLMWYFGPDLAEVATKVGRAQVGATARQDDPFYRWATAAAAVIPEDATYIFVDDYEAGKEIEARYYLVPRRHVLLTPKLPPSFLFYVVRQEEASFLLNRPDGQPPGPGVEAAGKSPAFQTIASSGSGLILKITDPSILGGFYD